MSTWDEHLADRLADAGYLAPAVDECGDYVTLVDAPLSEVMLVIREALLSDETIERAAEAVHHARGLDDYGVANEDEMEDARGIARAVLNAATGDHHE